MGKDKDFKAETPGIAFSRMNYLYQAANLISNSHSEVQSLSLSNYYIKIMKDISKKVVEKLHPDLKRTICTACNNPISATNNQIKVKVKPHRKKKRKKELAVPRENRNFKKLHDNQNIQYKVNRATARNKKPNKVCWSCQKCGFSKNFLQKPSYKLWIHKALESS